MNLIKKQDILIILCQIINFLNMIKKIKVVLFISIILWFSQFYEVKGSSNFSDPWFTIETKKITPIWKWNVEWSTLKEKAADLSRTVIDVLMIPIWVIALLIISVWAWYMIIYNWKEEFLTKWRNMITTWFLALFIALSSAYIIKAVIYIIYIK